MGGAASLGSPPSVTAFPWQEVMRLGLGVMRLPPQHFWRLTPREFIAICGHSQAATPPSKSDLYDLMRQFPDC
ncbi:MAG: rcc01693 family protein [Hyphomicrobiales bacterium]